MSRKQKLELTWIGKDLRPRLEPRILLDDPQLSHHLDHRVAPDDLFDNRMIFGDNLLALKALEQEFTGRVKCVYIDPPFNTKQAFEHYDDGVEHSLWLGLIRERLEIIATLLAPEGSLFIHIDDNELGYLIALADEVFGRRNRTAVATFTQSSASGPKAINRGMVTTNSYVLCYAKDRDSWSPNRVFVPVRRDDRYSKYIANKEATVAEWRMVGLREAFVESFELASWADARAKFADKLEYRLERFVLANADRVVRTARVNPKDVSEESRSALAQSSASPNIVQVSTRKDGSQQHFLSGEQLIFYSSKTKVIDSVLCTASPLTNLWNDLLSNNLHKEGGVSFPNGKKPEALLKRCLELSTEPGDLVLDSFGGSGTTAAVAHKMKRRWITVELGSQCMTHIHPRLTSVVDGTDSSGITRAVGWTGGGGFRFQRVAPSLLQKDKWGRWIVNPMYNAEMLAEALCKLEGFTYDPSDSVYWQHGRSTERDFLYVTTAPLNHEQLLDLSESVGDERSLLVLCPSFRGGQLTNITVKKIPKQVLARCEWGHDDYSLRTENLPGAPVNGGGFVGENHDG